MPRPFAESQDLAWPGQPTYTSQPTSRELLQKSPI